MIHPWTWRKTKIETVLSAEKRDAMTRWHKQFRIPLFFPCPCFFFFLMGLSKMGSVSLPLEPALINRGSNHVSVVSSPPRLPLQGGPGRWDLLKDSHLCQKVSHLFLPASPSCQAKVIIWPLNLWLTRDSQTSQEEPRKAANVTHRTMKYKSLSAADARKKKKRKWVSLNLWSF